MMLALSQEGAVPGERSLPVLINDCDWAILGDRLAVLLRGLDDRDVARLLIGLSDALTRN
jgi:hypothetical protein